MENKTISFWQFCESLSGYTILAEARSQYVEFCNLMANHLFREFVQSGLQSGEFSSRADFAFKCQKKFNASVKVSTFIYDNLNK